MMRWILATLLLTLPICAAAQEMTLKEKLAEANPGSYLVTEQNKTYTFLHVFARYQDSIVLEEVTIPAARLKERRIDWREWFENGAQGNTAWLLSQINLRTGRFEEVYSFTHGGWIDLSNTDSFMTTLLNLRFNPVPENYRKRIGLPPGHGKPDRRPFWNPRLVVSGMIVPNIPFSAWVARWPSDSSELSRKIIEIYLPEESWNAELPLYPVYFPYWVEVEGRIGSAKIRVVDSGMGVHSPRSRLPHRPPQFIGEGVFGKEGLALQIKSPPFFKEFILLAEEVDAPLGTTFPLAYDLVDNEDGTATLSVTHEELEKWMTEGARYRFILSPKEDPQICIETRRPLAFR